MSQQPNQQPGKQPPSASAGAAVAYAPTGSPKKDQGVKPRGDETKVPQGMPPPSMQPQPPRASPKDVPAVAPAAVSTLTQASGSKEQQRAQPKPSPAPGDGAPQTRPAAAPTQTSKPAAAPTQAPRPADPSPAGKGAPTATVAPASSQAASQRPPAQPMQVAAPQQKAPPANSSVNPSANPSAKLTQSGPAAPAKPPAQAARPQAPPQQSAQVQAQPQPQLQQPQQQPATQAARPGAQPTAQAARPQAQTSAQAGSSPSKPQAGGQQSQQPGTTQSAVPTPVNTTATQGQGSAPVGQQSKPPQTQSAPPQGQPVAVVPPKASPPAAQNVKGAAAAAQLASADPSRQRTDVKLAEPQRTANGGAKPVAPPGATRGSLQNLTDPKNQTQLVQKAPPAGKKSSKENLAAAKGLPPTEASKPAATRPSPPTATTTQYVAAQSKAPAPGAMLEVSSPARTSGAQRGHGAQPEKIAIPTAQSLRDDDIDDIEEDPLLRRESHDTLEDMPTDHVDDEGDDSGTDGYGDDFEDYNDDDFEEFHEEPIPTHIPVPSSTTMTPQPKQRLLDHTTRKDVDDVIRALDKENELASSHQQLKASSSNLIRSGPKPETPTHPLPVRVALDLDASRQKAQKTKIASLAEQRRNRRMKDLLSLIELDVCIYSHFELAPLNEYELYIRNYGSSNAVQASTQCNDDQCERECQTEDWEIEDKWTQAPPESFVDSASSTCQLPWLSASESRRKPKAGRPNAPSASSGKLFATEYDTERLIKFLRKSSRVMNILLDENSARQEGAFDRRVDDSLKSICDGTATLAIPQFLKGYVPSKVLFSPTDHRMFLAVWKLADTATNPDAAGPNAIISLWRLSDPTVPYRILICEPAVECVSFSRTKPHLIFGGTADGSIQVWNLLDQHQQHTRHTNFIDVSSDVVDVVVQTPSYSTDGLYSLERAHEDVIKNVVVVETEPLLASGRLGRNLGQEAAQTLGWNASAEADETTARVESGSCQLVTVDESGVLCIWVVIEYREESFSVNELDFGMAIGSCVKLVKTYQTNVIPSAKADVPSDTIVYDCQSYPTNTDHFLVLSTHGVVHYSRCQDRPNPPTFFPAFPALDDSIALPGGKQELYTAEFFAPKDQPRALSFSPHHRSLFVVGYESGLVCLFSISHRVALAHWRVDGAVLSLVWSPHRQAVFYCLDEAQGLYVWDLLEHHAEPKYVIRLQQLSGMKGSVAQLALSPLPLPTAGLVSTTELQENEATDGPLTTSGSMGQGRNSMPLQQTGMRTHSTLALAFESGKIECLLLGTELAEEAIDEEREFEEFLRTLGLMAVE